jgi:serine/threonine protein phosphatase 1
MRLAGLWNRWTARGNTRPGLCFVPLDPDQGPVYAIGDIHGCRGLLRGLVALIDTDAAAFPGQPTLVSLGDVIDRGPDSAGVLDDLAADPGDAGPARAILGNHERMMLSFFADPGRHLNWLDMGGFETLRSYGLALTAQDAAAMPQRRLSQVLAAHVPQAHLDWLAALPHGYRLHLDGEDFRLVHAGYDPGLPDDAQSEDVVIWGRAAPARPAPGGLRIVKGHDIVRQPDVTAQTIAIDTGAWQTGRLTALRLVSGYSPKLVCYNAGLH